jgi:hypothetical protein
MRYAGRCGWSSGSRTLAAKPESHIPAALIAKSQTAMGRRPFTAIRITGGTGVSYPSFTMSAGLLVTYASWRWVLFVNVSIGIGVALAALVVLPGAARRPGRLDLPGAITGTGGVGAHVYGLSNAATSPDGTSHWGDGKVVTALTVGAVLLAAFALVETRSRHALLPVRLLRQRDRLGANLIVIPVVAVLVFVGARIRN